jgi:hypothetical protein
MASAKLYAAQKKEIPISYTMEQFTQYVFGGNKSKK